MQERERVSDLLNFQSVIGTGVVNRLLLSKERTGNRRNILESVESILSQVINYDSRYSYYSSVLTTDSCAC